MPVKLSTVPVVFLVLAVGLAAAAADPVAEKYGNSWLKSPIPFRFGLNFRELEKTANEADVAEGRALFSLEGLGDSRWVQLAETPTFGVWQSMDLARGPVCCYVCQAEELFVGGQWKRYFGIVAQEGARVVTAAEVEIIPDDPGKLRSAWIEAPDAFDFRFTNPGVGLKDGKWGRFSLSVGGSVRVHALARRGSGEVKRLPVDIHRRLPDGSHSFRKGIKLRLQRSWLGPQDNADVVREDTFTDIPCRAKEHEADAGSKQRALEIGAVVEAWSVDLSETFEIREEGYYRFWYEIDFQVLGVADARPGFRRLEPVEFLVGRELDARTRQEANEKLGPLGTPGAESRLREVIEEAFRTAPSDAPEAPALPAEFPAFVRSYSFDHNESGEESAVLMLRCENSKLIASLDKYSASSVRTEMDRRRAAESKSPALCLIYAVQAASRGSKDAALAILEAMKSTDREDAKNADSAVAALLYAFQGAPPDWAVDLATTLISDDRFLTSLEDDGSNQRQVCLRSFHAEEVVLALGRKKCARGVPALLDRVRSHPADRYIINSLAEIGDERAIPVLMECLLERITLEYDETGLLPGLILAMGRLKAKAAVPVLLDHLEHVESVQSLEMVGDARAIPHLRRLVSAGGRLPGASGEDNRASERLFRARLALAVLEPGDVIPRLCALFRDSALDGFQRSTVVYYLRDRGDTRAIPFLKQSIDDDPDGYVTLACIQVLGHLRSPEAVETLIACLSTQFKKSAIGKGGDGHEFYIYWAAEGLRHLTGQDFKEDAAAWRGWWESNRKLFDPGK